MLSLFKLDRKERLGLDAERLLVGSASTECDLGRVLILIAPFFTRRVNVPALFFSRRGWAAIRRGRLAVLLCHTAVIGTRLWRRRDKVCAQGRTLFRRGGRIEKQRASTMEGNESLHNNARDEVAGRIPVCRYRCTSLRRSRSCKLHTTSSSNSGTPSPKWKSS